MTLLDPTTALIYNTDDLEEAVSTDNGIDLVYFGASFTLTRRVTINPNKPSLVFDGTYLGTRYTFTDMNSLDSYYTLGVRSPTSISMTFRHINLVGRNYYGIPYVPNDTQYSGVSTIYEDVTYTGIQINHNPFGYTRFNNCNITITGQEVAEVTRLELEGDCTFNKTSSGTSVFFLYGTSSARPFMRVLAGANVYVSTPFYFFYEHNPPIFTIESGASLTIEATSGMVYDTGHTLYSFTVEPGGSFRFIQKANRGLPSMLLDGPLTVGQDASFYMEANFTNINRLIYFTNANGGLYINDPKSFALYNRGNTLAYPFYFAATIPVTITGGQVNYWQTAVNFPLAGSLDDHPTCKWKRLDDYSPFTLTGTQTNSTTTLTSNLTPEDLAPLEPISRLQLTTARVFSVGKIPLEVYSAVITRRVTGKTEPSANVQVTLLPSFYVDPQVGVADGEGLYAVVPLNPMPYSDMVEVHANTPFLIVTERRAVMEADLFEIASAPIHIDFLIDPIDIGGNVILPRDLLTMPVTINDTRDPKTDWTLWACIEGPLETDTGETLRDAVVFVLQNGVMDTMTLDLRPVHQGELFPQDSKTITWPSDEGLFARITDPIRSGKRYQTRLGWFLTEQGAIPGEED